MYWSVRISLAIARFITMTSQTARRPRPSGLFTSTCVITRDQALAPGRLLVLLALVGGQRVDDAVDRLRPRSSCAACRAPGGRFRRPSSPSRWSRDRAARRPGSRPDLRAWRARTPSANVGRCVPTSRCTTWRLLLRWTNSIGSSSVMMLSFLCVLSVIDHGGERRRLARACRAGHEHQALVVVAELPDDRRQRRESRAWAPRPGWSGTRPRRRSPCGTR